MKKKNNFEDDEEQKLNVREDNKGFEKEDEDSEENEDTDEEESENSETTEELEEIVSRTPAPTPISQRAMQRQTVNPSLEISEEPQLESQLQDTPATQTRTETDNTTRYVANTSSYSASASYEPARGDYEEAGYPKQTQVRNIRFEQPTPFITPSSFDTSQIRQPIVKPWMNQMQNPSQSIMQPAEEKYEPISDTRRSRRRLL